MGNATLSTVTLPGRPGDKAAFPAVVTFGGEERRRSTI
jgi:hypothetical protein